ncbi:ATP-binding domain-containing protein, partial [Patescibacteria group bacterium]|nr:ATP-binding domain-containing protein [Patescibacteria group bacterium]
TNWEDIDQEISSERFVVLQKVYRNTREILNYISNLGYAVAIPSGIKSGAQVVENKMDNKADEMEYLKNLLNNHADISLGILAHDNIYLNEFKEFFSNEKRVHCLSMQEAQGVEFDIVCLVGIDKDAFSYHGIPQEIKNEIKKIDRDLLYVALTRAISELHVLGKDKLKECLSFDE